MTLFIWNERRADFHAPTPTTPALLSDLTVLGGLEQFLDWKQLICVTGAELFRAC